MLTLDTTGWERVSDSALKLLKSIQWKRDSPMGIDYCQLSPGDMLTLRLAGSGANPVLNDVARRLAEQEDKACT
jgi:hypothetical protein